MAYKSVTHSQTNNPNSVEQWVSKVINYSSQYDSESWPASCVEGQPKVYPKYGDIAGAWAQHNKDAHQFIEVEYKDKIYIEKIDIYETYHAGSVKKIKAKRPNGQWYTVWETPKVCVIHSSRIFSPNFEKLSFQCNVLRIEVDCTVARNWTEIDAIKIVGTKFNFDLPPLPEDITEDLVQLVNNDQYSDISFNVNGKIFHGHRAILSVRSKYFKAIFTGTSVYIPVTEKKMYSQPPPYTAKTQLYQLAPIEITDVDDKAFAVVLHYIYTNKLPTYYCESPVLPKVWRAADKFSLDGLKSLAIIELSTSFTVDNVVDIYVDVISSSPVIENIKLSCESFMQENMTEIVRLPTFRDLPHDLMVELIQKMTEKMSIK